MHKHEEYIARHRAEACSNRRKGWHWMEGAHANAARQHELAARLEHLGRGGKECELAQRMSANLLIQRMGITELPISPMKVAL